MKRKGIGYACGFYGTGYGNGFPDESRVDVEIQNDGSYNIYAAAADVGQGCCNVMRQIAAEVLETQVFNIKVISSSTFETEDSGTTAATRQTYNTGNAVLNACLKLKDNIDQAKKVSREYNNATEQLYSIMIKNSISTRCKGYFKADTTALDSPYGQGNPYWPYVFGVVRAVVVVDDETGKVDVTELTACHDVGKAINPMMLEGQIEGGSAMGIGFAIMEESEFIEGDIKNKNFSGYIIPTCLDVPCIDSIMVEEEEISGPFGAKGIGEPALIPVAPAIINAIYNAVKIRISNLPANQERIVEALKQKGTSSK